MKKVKINYNDTFGTMHSRDYYRGASFHFSGKWISGAHYVSDDYNIDFVVHGQTLLACAKSHLSSLDNEPTKFITDESGTIIGVISTYWDFVLSGIVGNSPGVKIIDNYWYICKNTGVPEEEQVWENTGVKAKMELSDLSPEEIALLQEPGKQVVTEFVNNTITQETGQNIDKIMSQKAVTDALSSKATVSQVTSAIANEVQRADLTYQPKGDYATNTTVNANREDADNKFTAVNERIDTTNENVSNNADAIQEEIENRESEIERIEGLISAEETARVESDNALSNRISQEATARSTADNNLEQSIANINSKIPSEATAFNQLADKDFVHNEISTSSATFRGTYNTLAELEAQEADNNDYGFVVHTDALGNTIYSRYKYNGTEWLWEYDITSTEFSQSQWEAVNSGINSTLVTKLSDLPTNADLTTVLNSKVDKVTGKQLSTEDYTTTEKTKLSGIAEGAQVNVLEGVKVDGTELPITDKKVNIDLSGKVNVADSETNSDTFVYRQTGDGLDVEAENARIDSIKGKTLVWNQLTKFTGNPAPAHGLTFGKVSDIEVSVTGTCDSNGMIMTNILGVFPSVIGHKYLIKTKILSGTVPSGAWIANGYAESKTDIGGSKIYQTNYNSQYLYVACANAGDTFVDAHFTINFIDLTQMFGAGNEPSTVEEFESLFPLPYYEYNTGTLINNDAEAIESIGFNKWDEEWEIGDISRIGSNIGQNIPASNILRSANYIPVLNKKVYYCNKNVFIYEYDTNKNFIFVAARNMITFSLQSTTAFIRFVTRDALTTYNNDICINISNPAKNGTYEPYKKFTLPLGLNNIKVKSHNIWDEEWENGYISNTGELLPDNTSIRSKNYLLVYDNINLYIKIPSGTIRIIYYDANKQFINKDSSTYANQIFSIPTGTRYIKFYTTTGYGSTYNHDICINVSSSFNGQYEPYGILTINGLKSAGNVYDEIVGNKYIKRVGEVDLGTLNWEAGSENTWRASLNMSLNNNGTNFICPKFVAQYKILANLQNGEGRYVSLLYLKDTSYSDATIFKTAVSGVMFYYELATPIEYELVESIRTDYPVDKLGTERVISDTVPTPPFRADITYHETNIKDIEVEGITEYLKREELTDELDKLDTIEDGAQENKIEHIQINGTEQTITNKTVNLPAYPTTLPASDVSAWAKAATKPSYNFSEIGGTVADSQLPDTISSNITGTAMGLKTEKLTDQEFVFRKSPNTINAKSMTLDRIKGKTLAWNQLVPPNGISTKTESGITITNNRDGSYTINGTCTSEIQWSLGATMIGGHKYYVRGGADGGSSTTYRINAYNEGLINSSQRYIFSSGYSGKGYPNIQVFAGAVPSNAVFKPVFIDLTLMFGSGNEPSTVEEFEAMFPKAYYPYNAGTLISNDAEALETVGFNQWDEEWENGSINDVTGAPYASQYSIRSKNYIPVFPNTQYYIINGAQYFYDANHNFISRHGPTGMFTTPSNCAYMKIVYGFSGAPQTTYNHDICINLSDASKNGTYEPYWKRTLNLGLSSFKVKDGQGNVLTITGGLKSAGTIYDEIVGNKYIKRIGEVNMGTLTWNYNSDYQLFSSINQAFKNYAVGVCQKYIFNSIPSLRSIPDKGFSFYPGINNNTLNVRDSAFSDAATFKTAMSGVMLYYELATPIEYDLVEPLVYMMKAGTTEARISPNEDGLSAPFRGDITYSVADYIEYADRAGTLVKGASIDLTDITANGELSGNAFKVIAEHIAKLTSRIEALENGIGVTDTLSSNSVDSANGYYINGDKTVIIGSGAPTVVPAFAGQFYINTSGPALYYAVNNSATTDWKQA